MKKIILLILLLIPIVVYGEGNKLYDVLKNEVESGGVAKEYTGLHQDSYYREGTEKIYHWFTASATDTDAILNMNNVIFGGVCWQIIRTTDTGGIRVLYNGYAEDGKCLNTRGNQMGFDGRHYYSMNYPIYYGDSFEYDSETNQFKLTGDLIQETWSDSTYSNLVGKYTCRSSEPSVTCSRIYYVESYRSNYDANLYEFYRSVQYQLLAKSGFNRNPKTDTTDVPSFGGYKYYKFEKEQISNSSTEGYLFSKNATYRDGKYYLDLTDTVTSTNINYRYTCLNNTGECEELHYLNNTGSYSHNTNPFGIYYTFRDGDFSAESFEKVLHGNNENSTAKNIIDRWYKDRLVEYKDYIEETVFCNERTEFGSTPNNWITNGGVIDIDFQPQFNNGLEEENGNNIICKDNRDKFSIANDQAKLEYSIALPSMNELLLLTGKLNKNSGIDRVRNQSGDNYWTMSPTFSYNSVYNWAVQGSGQIYPMYNSDQFGIRPMISLRPNIRYVDGDGSMNNPYVIDYSFIINLQDGENGSISIDDVDLKHVNKGDKIVMNVKPNKGYELFNIEITATDGKTIEYNKEDDNYYFIMPGSDVNLKPIFNKKKVEYKFIEGMGQLFDVVNDSKLRFIVNMKYDDFIVDGNVYIDREVVDKKYYELSKDSSSDNIIIIFNDEYSKKLKLGKHQIVTMLSNGETAVTDFSIDETTFKGLMDNPITGDKVVIILVTILLSFEMIILLLKKKVFRYHI